VKVIVKGSFDRDISKVKSRAIRLKLSDKIAQIQSVKDISFITSLKLLRGYTNHYRIAVKTEDESYRIGAIIRGDTVWLVRFLPRKIIYRQFP
jgi:mRNA interferase RelE/StbE